MLNLRKLTIDYFVEQLKSAYRRTYGDMEPSYAGFYWGVVSPYIQDALRYLHQTQEGKEWVNNLYSLVFAAEHAHHGS